MKMRRRAFLIGTGALLGAPRASGTQQAGQVSLLLRADPVVK